MKTWIVILLAGVLLPFGAEAQLGKMMAKLHKKDGVSVTQLDKSLYGLYHSGNLAPEETELLGKLDEVNILGILTQVCGEEATAKMLEPFRERLAEGDGYRLVKSRNNGFCEEAVYVIANNAKGLSDVVVWSQTPAKVTLVELRGTMQAERIAKLPRVLDVEGLEALEILAPEGVAKESAEMEAMARDLQGLMKGFFGNLDDGFFQDMKKEAERLLGGSLDSLEGMGLPGGIDPSQLKGMTQQVQQYFQSMGSNGEVMSNSVEIIEKDGKTELKVNAENTDITYVIDGVEAPKDKVQLPERIRKVQLVPSPKDPKKSYLFVTSHGALGKFGSWKEGRLAFTYQGQEYQYNLAKSADPLLVVDGQLRSTLDIDPASILQIRPVTAVEEMLYAPAKVMILTNWK